MGQFSDVQHFIDMSRQARDLDELESLLHGATNAMGFDYYALVQHIDVRAHDKQSVVWIENYPRSWAEVFIHTGLYASDPINLASHRTAVGFSWSDVPRLLKLNNHHRKVLDTARREGMGDGFTVPANIPGEISASCSFAVRAGRDMPGDVAMMAQMVGSFAFEAARKLVVRAHDGADGPTHLTPRQLECLSLVAKGKSDWEIGQILGLKESTVRDYVEDARERYNVKRRVQLVLRAVHDGHLTLSDAIG